MNILNVTLDVGVLKDSRDTLKKGCFLIHCIQWGMHIRKGWMPLSQIKSLQ